jgi:PGF-CTERM protein
MLWQFLFCCIEFNELTGRQRSSRWYADSDGDGWSDEKEQEMGTNPYSVDSDSDGLNDPEDPNPTVPEEQKKTPGFQVPFALAGLLAVAYFMLRRMR